MKLAAEHLIRAVGRRVEFRAGLLVPEAVVAYTKGYNNYLADLMWVTRSDYATEFEIKLSRADWRADMGKAKWGLMPAWITRFIYVVPKELGIPDFVPEWAGVWHWQHSKYYHSEIVVARAPRKIGQHKVPSEVKTRWMYHLHCRFWYQRLYTDKRLPAVDLRAAAVMKTNDVTEHEEAPAT